MSADTEPYHVYTILAEMHQYSQGGWQPPRTYAVAAESEYGAVKRFAAHHVARIKDVELIPGRVPEYGDERHIEGVCLFDWAAVREDNGEGGPHHDWQYR